MGPTREPAVVFSAIGSLAFFSCYFARLVLGVPQHWGVSHKDRLSRHLQSSLQGFIVEILNAVFSLATCVLFVLETYECCSNYDFIVRSFSLELAFNGLFLFNFLLHFYLATGKLAHLVSLQAMVDIASIFPSYLLLFIDDGSPTTSGRFTDMYLSLKVTRVIRVARLLVTISYFFQGPSLAFDHSRQVLVLRSQLIRWSLKTLVVIFIMAGLTNFLVEVQDADWGTGAGRMPFHIALYYIVVSFSTVGYGDISPSTPLSRTLIAGAILSLFFCAPLVTNALVNITRLTPKHGGRLSKSWGTGHIVVGCDSSCLRVVSVLLRELLAADSMVYHTAHVVVVVPREPTLAWQALLCLQPSFAVTYLNGDLRSAEDLRRARVGHARACFVLSDRLAADTQAQDKTALVRALCVHQASPPGGSVLCLVTHRNSKRRLVRLGVPATGVVCYDDVMERLVAHACLHPGFSTVWANILSCMPESDQLLKTREGEKAVLRSPEATVLFETEVEYLRSLQRVMFRFHLNGFSGENTGDVAIELHRECGCTLFALISTSCSGGHEDGMRCDGGELGKRCARVHPDYRTELRDDDVGVFIGDSHKGADLLARYCAGRRSSAEAALELSSRHSPFARSRKRVGGRLPQPNRREEEQGREQPQHPQQKQEEQQQQLTSAFKEDQSQVSPRRQPPSYVYGTVASRGRGGSDCTSDREFRLRSIEDSAFLYLRPASPLGEDRLAAPPPGFVLVIAQSLSYALGVVLALCDADADFEGGSSAVKIICPPTWWDPTVDEAAERELAARFPSARLIKSVPECAGLLRSGADRADLVCIVPSRVSERHESASHRYRTLDAGEEAGQSFGDHGGLGQGSDGWAMGILVDVLGLVPESTRVVVRFDDPASAEQHQVISAHVRRRAAVLGGGRRDRERRRQLAASQEQEEKGEGRARGDQEGGSMGMQPLSYTPRDRPSPHELARQSGVWRTRSETFTEGGLLDAPVGGDGGRDVFFDDTRGVVHEGFDDFSSTMSGYVSGDVVIGNAAELLLLQTMVAPDIQSIMNDVLTMASRIPIEALWPEDPSHGMKGKSVQSRPGTYGEAYQSLLKNRGMLALGLHRSPTSSRDATGRPGSPGSYCSPHGRFGGHADPVTGEGSRGARDAAADERFRCPGGSRHVSILSPSADFELRDDDFLFILRRPKGTAATANSVEDAATPNAERAPGKRAATNVRDGTIRNDSNGNGSSGIATSAKSPPVVSSSTSAGSNSEGDSDPAAVETGAAADPTRERGGIDDSIALLGRRISQSTADLSRSERSITAPAKDVSHGAHGNAATRQAADGSAAVAEWALGLLVQSSRHRVACRDLRGRSDAAGSGGDDENSLLRIRVMDAAKRMAGETFGPKARPAAGDSSASDGSDGTTGAMRPAPPSNRGGLVGQRSQAAAAATASPPPPTVGCGRCTRSWGPWEEDAEHILLALGCGHTTCLDCLELLKKGKDEPRVGSSPWCCPSCGEAVSDVLPLL